MLQPFFAKAARSSARHSASAVRSAAARSSGSGVAILFTLAFIAWFSNRRLGRTLAHRSREFPRGRTPRAEQRYQISCELQRLLFGHRVQVDCITFPI